MVVLLTFVGFAQQQSLRARPTELTLENVHGHTGHQVIVKWEPNPSVTLERTTDLNRPWTHCPGTLGSSHFAETSGVDRAFYRLVVRSLPTSTQESEPSDEVSPRRHVLPGGTNPMGQTTMSFGPVSFADLDKLDPSRYRIPPEQLKNIRSRVLALAETKPNQGADIRQLYTDRGMSHIDSIIPYRASFAEQPEDTENHNKWHISNGQVREIEQVWDGTRWVWQRLWYTENDQPLMMVMYRKEDGNPVWYAFAEYEDDKVRRVLTFQRRGPDSPIHLTHLRLIEYSEADGKRTSYYFSHGGKKCASVVSSDMEYFLHHKFRALQKYGLAQPYGGEWQNDKMSNRSVDGYVSQHADAL